MSTTTYAEPIQQTTAPTRAATLAGPSAHGEEPEVAVRAELEETVIEPKTGWRGMDWPELWRFRELLYFLVWRDVKVKYKMAVLGFAWAVGVPLLSMLVYGTVGAAAGFDEQVEAPYLLWMLAGLLPWLFLQRAISDGGSSLVNQQQLMSKIYLPRLFIPASSVGGGLFDLGINLLILAGLAGIYSLQGRYAPTLDLLALPLVLLLTVVAALGTAFGLSALTVMYRDLRFIIPFLTQFGLWLSAVVYPSGIFGRWEWVLAFNPFAGVVSAWRSVVVGTPWQWDFIAGSVVGSVLLLIVGVRYFRGVERRFADVA